MPVLTAENLHKSFGPQCILKGASLSVHTGERVGLVGLNGSGKSTLVKMLAGLESPDSGTIARRRGTEMRILLQEPELEPSSTARQIVLAGLTKWFAAKTKHEKLSEQLEAGTGNIDALLTQQADAAHEVERLGGWDMAHKAESVLGHVGLPDPDRIISTLSGGERRRVALAQILVAQPDLAILDEPSNHLDVETIEWLEKYLIDEYRGAILLITHDRFLLDRVVERTLELNEGTVYSYEGGYEAYLEAKAERMEHLSRTESNRQNFLRTEIEWLRRQPKARSTKQKARIQRAETAIGVEAPKIERVAHLAAEGARSGKTILELQSLGLDIGERPLVNKLDLFLSQGERVGIVGKSGTGKTTLLRAILGEVIPARGSVVLGKNTKLVYFDQQRSALLDDVSIWENIAEGRDKIEVFGNPMDVRTYLERFLFSPQKQRQPVGSLSGGERARVALAKMLAQPSNLIFLDEPTNDLDVLTLGALEQMLLEFNGSALIVTHDRWFLNRVATSILAFEGDGRVTRYAGNYDAYVEQRGKATSSNPPKASRNTGAVERSVVPQEVTKDNSGSRKKGLTYGERIELEGLLAKVDAAEQTLAQLEGKLADPTLYAARGQEVSGPVEQVDKAKREVARLMNRWEELEAKKA